MREINLPITQTVSVTFSGKEMFDLSKASVELLKEAEQQLQKKQRTK